MGLTKKFLCFVFFSFLLVIPIYGQEEANQVPTVLEILEQAKKAANTIPDKELRTHALRDVALVQLKAWESSRT